MRRLVPSVALALLLGVVPTCAQTPFSGGLLLGSTGPAGYVGPGDIIAFTAWYGARAYTAAVAAAATQKIFNIRKVAAGSTCDVLIGSNGYPGITANCSTGGDNGQTSSSYCGTGTQTACKVTKIYDQTNGNSCGAATCDLLQATSGSQMNLSFSLPGTDARPIIHAAAAYSEASANNFTPTTGLLSFSLVVQRVNSSTTEGWLTLIGSGNTMRGKSAVAATWELLGNGSGFSFTASTGNTTADMHKTQAVINGASSVVRIDGIETTGTATGSTTGAKPTISSTGFATDYWREFGWINNVALTSGQRVALEANQATFW